MSDSLSIKSRNFYEYSGMKMAFSLVLAALGMYAMDRLCCAGGQSKSYNIQGKDQSDTDVEDAFKAVENGYGFAAFFFFLAAMFFWGAALYVSPVVFGYVCCVCLSSIHPCRNLINIIAFAL
jgi:membrane glycosyltransferase